MSSGIIFGVNVSTTVGEGHDPVATAVRAEELGLDFVSSSDHPEGSAPTYETWTMLSFVAAATSRIRIATRVLGVPYRPPAIVAKMAETLDRLSRGRLILGLGSGYSDSEHRAFGLGVRSAKDKTDGLAEAISVMRGLWAERDFTFNGRIYHTDGANLEPKPGRPIPIWLGTFAPRGLAITGRLADGWIPSLGYAPRDELAAMRERVLDGARQAGRSPSELTCALNVVVEIGSGKNAGDAISGEPPAVARELVALAALGFNAFNFMLDDTDPSQLARLAIEVLPLVRAQAGG
jgi:alkanesulfonate monooxygenase SsuD/methylene tetrahydromethanopterin reductase-like flavin-dependent oxidoreductase (luciferase family)